MDLKGKSVLITGGRRVGGELALSLADRGANVAMTFRNSRDAIEATVEKVRGRGVRGLSVEADLAVGVKAEAAVRQVVDAFGRLDVLVNMASIFRRTPFAGLTPDDFDEMIATNLAAPYHSAVFAGRQMLRQGGDAASGLKGKIIQVGDWSTNRPYVDYLPYIVAKGGLSTMTMALAKELAPHVTVNLVEPSMIEPPEGTSEAEIEAVTSATLLKRRGTPGDLNRLILFLIEGGDFITGTAIRVDGGRFLGVDPSGTI